MLLYVFFNISVLKIFNRNYSFYINESLKISRKWHGICYFRSSIRIKYYFHHLYVHLYIHTNIFLFFFFNSVLIINKVVYCYIYIVYLWYTKWNKGHLQHFIIKNATRILFIYFFFLT